ncbi:hypothetical protein BV898_00847 [Hypsibius exemplaris]|uniref:Uncharacterized protein n=1 Tax=Hypsibius exemplaris TaxID=2072580 RepID=A0A1W0XCC3_HYPEX|nr:hypothetical protein BV898_00847 [Hypsibius exemplaris]
MATSPLLTMRLPSSISFISPRWPLNQGDMCFCGSSAHHPTNVVDNVAGIVVGMSVDQPVPIPLDRYEHHRDHRHVPFRLDLSCPPRAGTPTKACPWV